MSRPRHVPLRRCAACRASLPKRELLRLVRSDAGWTLDLRQRAGGRGTSLCPACALAALRRDDPARLKGFRRAFRDDADAVTALIAEIEATLTSIVAARPTAATEPTPRAPAPAAAERTRPNGGMHG